MRGGRKLRLRPNLKYCRGICLEALEEIMRGLSQNNWYPGQDLNRGPQNMRDGYTFDGDVWSILIKRD
jgi:hypothetical protein